ncbi:MULTISPECIES: patatin-like phospholipase family protein [unclassified Thiomonas]|uniref:patatin-like phospholipase family protein n=1 Tax=unclassified Thiomonas TaxID=2625466 RepID=UPI0004DBA863|nr:MULTISPECIES: patatin-like phospholipase family protein [unclassified Thiomonas]MDD4999752.1 patatin-like phospholipase family protein [Thiomonas arsenitoxydans]CQR44118.1 putative Patatin [Thiomonas sp. CB3]CDW94375.1 putative Patatin [Thiomonas sp. CB2]VDY06109.1 putative Patatin [Thiomonas sp. Bio17B3]VDY10593.1 putative Patatin [Thiomonas sp. Sup16B3]
MTTATSRRAQRTQTQAKPAEPAPSCRADAVLAQVRHYDRIALVLQGGGALGAYQCGVVEALEDCGVHPHWVAGISIGSINAALIAGNPPGQRAAALRTFWETVTQQPLLPTLPWEHGAALAWIPEPLQPQLAVMQGLRAILEGQRGFFLPRWPLGGNNPAKASFYDTAPLRDTLEKLVDFDRLNSGETRISVGAVNVRNGNQVVFDSAEMRLGPEHIMASGALPPGFPAVEIDGEFYWDGGLVSNTPLSQVLGGHPSHHTLVFQVDLWSAAGEVPKTLLDVAERQKDIQFSSRTRIITSTLQRAQQQRRILRDLLQRIPLDKRDALCEQVQEMAQDKRYNVIHLIYRDKAFDGQGKDYAFGRAEMRSHWQSGLDDMHRTLDHPDWFALPSAEQGFVTHDVHTQA